MLIGCLLYCIILKQKFHPGSLFLWEAWWKLSVQRYKLFLFRQWFFQKFSITVYGCFVFKHISLNVSFWYIHYGMKINFFLAIRLL